MENPDPIVRLQPAQHERATEVLTAAFHDLHIFRAVYPEGPQRRRALRRLMATTLRYCLLYGEVYTTRAVEGLACWLPPGKTSFTPWRALRSGLLFTLIGSHPRIIQGLLEMGIYSEKVLRQVMPRPHWYLWALGVAPESQGRGIGGKLMAPILQQAALEGKPCYLETDSEKNVAFYQKHGFTVAYAGKILRQKFGFWAMIKEPA